MGISVLGPLLVDGEGSTLGPRDRVVLAALAVRAGEPVSADQLADAMWGEAPPASWAKVVQGCVVRLRKQLGSDAIETSATGYRLRLAADAIDALQFQRMVDRGRELTAFGEPERAGYLLGEALALWRGRPFAELDGWPPAQIEADRLEELRMDVEEAYLETALAAGRHREVLADAHARAAERPLREHRWALLATAQYRCGRQAEALRTVHRARQIVVEELGVDPGPELVALEQALLRQDSSLDPIDAGPESNTTCPYPGLLAYDVDDADAFFGRDDDVAACLRRLSTVGSVTVVGPSGSGKSSLVRAGIGGALRREGRRVVVITPGTRPLDALSGVPTSEPPPVLIVDQCEEAVTLCFDVAERQQFFAALAAHADRGLLAIAVRADHLGRLAGEPTFARLVERSVHLLGVMDEPQLRAAIEGPARQAGLLLEPGLVDLLVREVEGEPGALPLLSHALHLTWQRREGRTLTVQAYRETGGIREAVGRSAEAVYDRIPEEERPVLRDLLLRLVTPTPEGEPVRARVPRELLDEDPIRLELVERLVDARLLTSDDGVVELAHESLVRAWPRMREWLADDVEGQRILRHLSAAAASWEAMDRPDSELYRGARLARTVEWRDRSAPRLTPLEATFVETSLERETADLEQARTQLGRERRTVRRLRTVVATAAVLAVLAAAASVVAVGQQRRADERATIAEARRLGARALIDDAYDRALLLGVEAVNVWDVAETRGNLLTTIERNPGLTQVIRHHGHRILDLRTSSDGSRVAVADTTDDVTVYDTRSRTVLAEVGALETSYRIPTFAPDGQTFALSMFATSCWQDECESFEVQVYDVDDTSTPTSYTGLGLPAAGIAFSPDGRLLAAAQPMELASRADNVAIWRVGEPGEPVQRLTVADRGVGLRPTADSAPSAWVEFSPDGRTLYASGDGRVTAFRVATGEVVRTYDGMGALDLSRDGSTLAVAATPRTVRLLDTGDGSVVTELAGRSALVLGASISPEGDVLTTAHDDGTVAVWDAASGDLRQLLEGHTGNVHGIGFGGDGTELFTAGADRKVLTWELSRSHGLVRELAPPLLPAAPGSVVVAPGGRRAAIVGNRVHVVDPAANAAIEMAHSPEPPFWAAFTGDGRRLITVAPSGRMRLLDATTGELIVERAGEHGANRGAIATVPGTRTLVVAAADGLVVEHDADTLEPTGRTLQTGVSADGIRATVGGVIAVTSEETATESGSEVVFADLGEGRILHRIQYGSWGPRANFSPDGTRYALGGFDGRVGVIDVATGRVSLADDPVHEGPVNWVTFSPDSRTLASIGSSQVVLADATTGQPWARARPRQREGAASAISFRDDGRTLVVAYDDGSVLSYDTAPSAAIDHACAVAGRNLTRDEWRSELGHRPYRRTCPQFAEPAA